MFPTTYISTEKCTPRKLARIHTSVLGARECGRSGIDGACYFGATVQRQMFEDEVNALGGLR
jgi:hypothetical protein